MFCFDKTGTLTEQEVNIKGICKVNENNKITTDFIEEKDDFVMQILGSCHTAREIEGEFKGSEIDR